MGVHWTCPAVRAQDPVAIENDEKPGPCPGHAGPCQILGTPRPRHQSTKNQVMVVADLLGSGDEDEN